jgi:DNA topoisomerase-2
MHGFDEAARLRRVATPLDVIEMHAPVRLATYEARRAHELAVIERELLVLDAKARFLELVCSGELSLGRVPHQQLVATLQRLNFAPLGANGAADRRAVDRGDDEGEGTVEGGGGGGGGGSGYKHLLGMPLQSLTEERLAQLSKRRETRRTDAEELRNTTAKQIWMRELEALRPALQAAIERPSRTK